MLDNNESILARDLCILLLIQQLNDATDDATRLEVKTTLMYTFCGAVMPWYCWDR